jgi:hypothetical protein
VPNWRLLAQISKTVEIWAELAQFGPASGQIRPLAGELPKGIPADHPGSMEPGCIFPVQGLPPVREGDITLASEPAPWRHRAGFMPRPVTRRKGANWEEGITLASHPP